MRDLERWKEQVELSLDGRQIFFLFFGSAVAACVLFIAGVLVGKRIEQRACMPTAAADPLAVLDQLGSDDGLTFHQALGRRERSGSGRRNESASRRNDAEVRNREASLDEPTPASGAAAVPAAAAASATPEAAPARNRNESDPPARAPAVEAAKKPDARKPDSQPKPDNRAAAQPARVMPPHDGKPASAPAQASTRKPEASTPANGNTAERYTLQISAFTEKGEAEDFMRKIQFAGYRPFLVQSDIPGRGTFFRVRLGDFVSRKAAGEAKADFERKQHLPVYVVARQP